MVETIRHLTQAGLMPPTCVGIHGLFAGNAYADLRAASAGNIVTTTTVPHQSNAIDVAPLLAEAARAMMARAMMARARS